MNSITYISMGVNYDEAKAFVNEIQRQIKKYCRIIKKVKKEDKNKIYYFTKEQIKKSKKECRRLKIKYIFNEKFPVFFDIIDINHVIIHMLIIEMLIGKITGIENEGSNNNQESSSVEEIICKVNRTCSIAYEEAQNTLINNPKSDELYEKVCVYLENIKDKIDKKMAKFQRKVGSIDNSLTKQYKSIEVSEANFWIDQMNNWQETILKQAMNDLN